MNKSAPCRPAIVFLSGIRRLRYNIFTINIIFVLAYFSQVYTNTPVDVQIELIHPITVTTNELVYVICGTYVIYRACNGVSVTIAYLKGSLALSGLILLASLSVFWSPSTQYAQYKILRFLTVVPLLFTVSVVISQNERSLNRFLSALVLFGLAIAGISITGALLLNLQPWVILGSPAYVFIGRLFGGTLPIIVYLRFCDRETLFDWNVSFVVSVATVLLALLLAGARGPFLFSTFATIILIIHFLFNRDYVYDISWQSVAFFSILLLIVVLIMASVIDLLTVRRLGSITDVSGRLSVYTAALDYWTVNPILGNGIGSFGVLRYGRDVSLHPHNFGFEVLTELGIAGLLLLAAFISQPVFRLFRVGRIKDRHVILFSLFIFALLNASIDNAFLGGGDRMLFLTAGLLANAS